MVRLASTLASACIHGTRAADAGTVPATGAKPSCCGESRTRSQVATASSADAAAMPTNTARQEVTVTAQASGAPAATAPRLPANIVTPARVAKRSGANHTAETLSTAMKATDTPTPTSVRPTAAISHAGASANSSEPTAAIAEPAVRMRRGPSVSASTPTGICSSV